MPVKISDLPAATTLTGAEKLAGTQTQSGVLTTVSVLVSQILTYITSSWTYPVPWTVAQGGTGSTTAATARTALGAAASGANTDITSLAAPALGAATATTQSPGDNTTKVATTAFVTAAVAAAKYTAIPAFAGATVTAGSTVYAGGQYVWSASDANAARCVVPVACTISTLFAKVTTAPGSTKSAAFTLQKNGVDTALTCTISDTNTGASDTTHSVSFAAGDDYCMKAVYSAGAASSDPSASFVLVQA